MWPQRSALTDRLFVWYQATYSCLVAQEWPIQRVQKSARAWKTVGRRVALTEGSFTQWVHCEFVVSFEAIRPVITQQVCGEFF